MGVTSVETPLVRGFLHQPSEKAANGLVLAHGAGSDCRSPVLVQVSTAFCRAGWVVLRVDLPFRRKRPKGPPTPAASSEDRNGLRESVRLLRDYASSTIWLGGHSYGGRQASMLAAEDPELAAGLLLLSYPLHPPERSDRLRTEHWPALKTPSVFVHGTKDPFGSIEEMQAAFALLSVPARLVTIPGAGHELNRGKFDVDEHVLKAVGEFG